MATSSQKGELGLALEVLTQRFSAPTNLLFLLHLLVGGGQLSILLVVNAFGRVGVLVQQDARVITYVRTYVHKSLFFL